MTKKVLCFALATAMIFTFSGCKKEEKQVVDVSKSVESAETSEAEVASEKEEKAGVDVKGLAGTLLNDISYTDQLSEVDTDTASMFLNFADVEIDEACIYESSGATAEEIVVIKCKDSDSAAKAKEAFKQRVEEQTENFTDYVPEEVPKLKDAVVFVSGEYAVLSVSADSSKAKEIIAKAFK